MFIKNRNKAFIGINYLMMDIVLILRIICTAIFSTYYSWVGYTSIWHIITYIIFNTLLLFFGIFGTVCCIRDNEKYTDSKVILVILTLCIIASIISCACMIGSDELQDMVNIKLIILFIFGGLTKMGVNSDIRHCARCYCFIYCV